MTAFVSGRQMLPVLFAVSLAIANVTAAKLAWYTIPGLGEVAVPAGFIAFGVAFVCSDLMVEFYGRDYAHRVVNATLVALVVAWGLIYAAIAQPAAPFGVGQEAYASVLGSGAGVVFASVVTVAVSQHVDVRLFSHIRAATGGRHRWVRNLGSTTVSQAIDTVVFITLAFAVYPAVAGGDVMWGVPLVLTIVGQYVVKLVVAVLDTPVFYAVTSASHPGPEWEPSRGGDDA